VVSGNALEAAAPSFGRVAILDVADGEPCRIRLSPATGD
jgi:hypothetical protein